MDCTLLVPLSEAVPTSLQGSLLAQDTLLLGQASCGAPLSHRGWGSAVAMVQWAATVRLAVEALPGMVAAPPAGLAYLLQQTLPATLQRLLPCQIMLCMPECEAGRALHSLLHILCRFPPRQRFPGSVGQAGSAALPDTAAGPSQGCRLRLPHCPRSPRLPCCPPLCCPVQLQYPHLPGEAARGLPCTAGATGSSIAVILQRSSQPNQVNHCT